MNLKINIIALFFIFSLSTTFSVVFAQNTSAISIQGMLKDANGDPRVGSQSINVEVRDGVNPAFSTSVNLTLTAEDEGFYVTIIEAIPTILFKQNTQVVVDGIVSQWVAVPYADRAKSLDASTGTEGQILKVVGGVATWSNITTTTNGIQIMNQSNYNTSNFFENGNAIKLDGEITIGNELVNFNSSNNSFYGGSFKGSGIQSQLRFNSNKTFYNVKFENVNIIAAYDCAFINCTFRNVEAQTLLDSKIIASYISGLNMPIGGYNITFESTHIGSSNIQVGGSYINSDIVDCNIKPELLNGCRLRNTVISLRSNALMTSNYLDTSKINIIASDFSGSIQGNIFDRNKDAENEIINIENSGNFPRNINLSGNTFRNNSADAAIRISGNNSSIVDMLIITQNMFHNFSSSIINTSNGKVAITNNFFRRGDAGSLGTAIQNNNIDLD